MNATQMRRALDAVSARTARPGPTKEQWIEALAIVAATDLIEGRYRVADLTPSGAPRVATKPFPTPRRPASRTPE